MTETEWLASEDPAAMLRWISWAHQSRDPLPRPSDRKLRLLACVCVRRQWHLLTDGRSRRAVEVAEAYADGEMTADEMDAAWNDALDTIGEMANTAAWGAHSLVVAWADAAQATAYDDALAATQILLAKTNKALGNEQWRRLAALLRDTVGNPLRPTDFRPEWLTPDVLSLAKAAYGHSEADEECKECLGRGGRWEVNSDQWYHCPACDGEGSVRVTVDSRLADGTLDPDRLAVLSDALEEAGCPSELYATEKRWQQCPVCLGYGKVVDAIGTPYDPPEFSECPRCEGEQAVEVVARVAKPNPLLVALRSPGPHYRGFWALDMILGKE